MTTLPPKPEREPEPVSAPPSGDTHKLRTIAEGFGAAAARYDRARPS